VVSAAATSLELDALAQPESMVSLSNLNQSMRDTLSERRRFVDVGGGDRPEIGDWTWDGSH
jgi:hypothetical protein